MIDLLLLGTAGCHLCEQAEAVIASYQVAGAALRIAHIDIAEAEQWQARYAVRIPVLYHPQTTSELCWPFGLDDVNHFIETLND